MKTATGVALLLAACSSETNECTIEPGNYATTLTRLEGDCPEPEPYDTFLEAPNFADPGAVPPECSVARYVGSDGGCRVDFDFVCPVDSLDVAQTGEFIWQSTTSYTGETRMRITRGEELVCTGTFAVAAQRR